MFNIQTNAQQHSLFHNMIVRYGKLVEVKIRASKSRERAAKFVEETCWAFDYQCENEMIRSGFKEYVVSIFEIYWD